MASPGKTGAGCPPPSSRSRGGLLLPVLVEDPRLDALHHVERPVHRAQVVEVAPLAPRAEGPRREGHVDLALGALPQAEADEPRSRERTLLEVDLGLGHETLETVLSHHELHPHRSPPRDPLGPASSGGWPLTTASTSPRLAEITGGRRGTRETTPKATVSPCGGIAPQDEQA